MSKRIIGGILLTVVFLVVAKRLSTNKAQDIVLEAGGMRIEHTTVFEQVGPGRPLLELRIAPSDGVEARVVFRVDGAAEVLSAEMSGPDEGRWFFRLPDMGKGHRIQYAFEIDRGGSQPERLPEAESDYFPLKYKGEVSALVLVLHIIFMFAGFFFMTESFIGAFGVLAGRDDKRFAVLMTRWTLITMFIGGWPLGFILNRQRFGPVWEGFPFGYDITDNKTQIMFVFWILASLVSWKSIVGREEEPDAVRAKGFAAAVITSYVVSLAVFLIPHSL